MNNNYYSTDKEGNITNISINVESNINGKEIDYNSDEVELLTCIINHMGLDINDFEFKKTAENYTTLTYHNHDLIRLHSDDKSSWIRLPIYNISKYENDLRFKNQTNKNQHFWFSYINNLFEFEDVITDAMEYILSGKLDPNTYEPNDEEIIIASVIMNYMNIDNFKVQKNNKEKSCVYVNDFPLQLFDIKCGAKSKWLEVYDTKQRISLIDFNEDMLPSIANILEKEIKKRAR